MRTMEKVWLVMRESNIDGETSFSALPFANEDSAVEYLKNTKESILSSRTYSGLDEDDFDMEDEKCHFWISLNYDDYYEDVWIEEHQVFEKA